MQNKALALTAGLTLSLSACAATPAAENGRPCPVTESSGWTAFVNAMPGPGARPTLIATGKVTVPTGGYRFEWSGLTVMESDPVQASAELRPIPPDGPATQALETHDLRGEWPVDPPVGSFTLRCGERVLARISPVETAR